jgi:hypothetical protein
VDSDVDMSVDDEKDSGSKETGMGEEVGDMGESLKSLSPQSSSSGSS